MTRLPGFLRPTSTAPNASCRDHYRRPAGGGLFALTDTHGPLNDPFDAMVADDTERAAFTLVLAVLRDGDVASGPTPMLFQSLATALSSS